MAVQSNSLRDTLRFWGSGVSVVATIAGDEHKAAGMTVSAFNSLSLEPPLILVSLAKGTTTTDALLKSGVFSVSILSGDQAELSDRFAGRTALPAHADRFDGVPTITAVTGSPILQDALAWLDCRVHQLHDGSTHWIVIGEVLAAGHKDAALSPLIYFNRAYYDLFPEAERP
jgi:flavin reductase (DIM6/NTAB) family NADH-FMN oxidoreductase RutF